MFQINILILITLFAGLVFLILMCSDVMKKSVLRINENHLRQYEIIAFTIYVLGVLIVVRSLYS